MSVSDALQLMLSFGIFIIGLMTFVVELIKFSQKNNRP
ncbi:putative holin-like toxin [Lentilactobacillus otakiensis]